VEPHATVALVYQLEDPPVLGDQMMGRVALGYAR
jgi:hypothetical protein